MWSPIAVFLLILWMIYIVFHPEHKTKRNIVLIVLLGVLLFAWMSLELIGRFT